MKKYTREELWEMAMELFFNGRGKGSKHYTIHDVVDGMLLVQEKLFDDNTMLNDIKKLLEAINESEAIYDSALEPEDWEIKYDLIFGLYSRKIKWLVQNLNLRFDWYDPDTSYEEDVTCYMRALGELKSKLQVLQSNVSKEIE